MTTRMIDPVQQGDLAEASGAEVSATPKIALKAVARRFGDFTAVDDVTLDITDGEFVVLLGPSGCGKSTLLRMIAGLQEVSSGVIEIQGERANDIGPVERDLAFVFQNYALYPHKTVRRNLSFPLLMRKFRWWHHVPVVGWLAVRRLERSGEIADQVDRIADVLGLGPLIDRYPATLSGGQRQRVALGRAMVREPIAFLMDEPLSNLDAKLRGQMRAELLRFHRLLNTTIVYVTHDQVEAMTMGTRIGVMLDGRLQQYGTPRDVYESPANTFVAQFVGTPAMSLLPSSVDAAGTWTVGSQHLPAPTAAATAAVRAAGAEDDLLVGLRSEWLALADGPEAGHLHGEVIDVEDWGADLLVTVRLARSETSGSVALLTEDEPTVDVRASHGQRVAVGDRVMVAVDLTRVCLFDARSGEALPVQDGG